MWNDQLVRYKTLLRKALIRYRIPISKNIKNDIAIDRFLARYLRADSKCIDVGAHKGEILDLILKHAPQGHHWAFEPLPHLYCDLAKKYKNLPVTIAQLAISDVSGEEEFIHVTEAPAYSGLKKRDYPEKWNLDTIKVRVSTLDRQVPELIHLIKIDVEGGEYQVLRGAKDLIARDRPYIVFEFGKGASDYYATSVSQIFSFFHQFDYSIYSLMDWQSNKRALSLKGLQETYDANIEYNFVAIPN